MMKYYEGGKKSDSCTFDIRHAATCVSNDGVMLAQADQGRRLCQSREQRTEAA
jgi:hypothetical protein